MSISGTDWFNLEVPIFHINKAWFFQAESSGDIPHMVKPSIWGSTSLNSMPLGAENMAYLCWVSWHSIGIGIAWSNPPKKLKKSIPMGSARKKYCSKMAGWIFVLLPQCEKPGLWEMSESGATVHDISWPWFRIQTLSSLYAKTSSLTKCLAVGQ